MKEDLNIIVKELREASVFLTSDGSLLQTRLTRSQETGVLLLLHRKWHGHVFVTELMDTELQ